MEIIFTLHAEDRIKKRKIAKEDIIEAIEYPKKIEKKYGKYYAGKQFSVFGT